jgi:DNA-binding CsgD family transcriptional regulator
MIEEDPTVCQRPVGDIRPARAAPMIGRDHEIRQFTTLLDATTPGRPALLVVEGPPGSGRTRLLDEFAAVGHRRGVTVVLEPEWIGESGALRILRRGGGQEPMQFLCDNPRRVEPRVWPVLDLLAESHPLVVVVTARAGVDPLPAGHLAAAEVRRIRLAPLSPGEVERYATLLLAGRPDEKLLDLTRVAAGRPGAVQDLIAGLREEGLIRPLAGRAVLTEVRLPGRTRMRLLDQLAAMSPRARHLLQAATTLRAPFRLVRLTRLLQVSTVTLLPAIEEVLESGLLTGDDEMLRFSHRLVRSIVESSMPRPVVAALRDGRPVRSTDPATTPAAHRSPAARPARPAAVAAHPAADWSRLTPREHEVADLVGRALTNRQIASRLRRSPHTVNYHLRQIFRKLDITSRVELASLVRQREAGGATRRPASGPSSS